MPILCALNIFHDFLEDRIEKFEINDEVGWDTTVECVFNTQVGGRIFP